MDQKYKVQLQWIPGSPGVQTLSVTASDEEEAQAAAVSMASHIFETDSKEGNWQIMDVKSHNQLLFPKETYSSYGEAGTGIYAINNDFLLGDYDGDITYSSKPFQLYKEAGSSASEKKPASSNTSYTPYSMVSSDTSDSMYSGVGDSPYTPYSSLASGSDEESEPVLRQESSGYTPYGSTLATAESVESTPADSSYTPYSSRASALTAPDLGSEEEGVSASQVAGYTAYFPGKATASRSNKAYYAELDNGYSPYRAFRVSVPKGKKIII